MRLLIWSVFYRKFNGIHLKRSKQLLSTHTYVLHHDLCWYVLVLNKFPLVQAKYMYTYGTLCTLAFTLTFEFKTNNYYLREIVL